MSCIELRVLLQQDTTVFVYFIVYTNTSFPIHLIMSQMVVIKPMFITAVVKNVLIKEYSTNRIITTFRVINARIQIALWYMVKIICNAL